MDDDEKQRLVKVEVTVSAMASNIVEIKDYMKNSSVSKAANHSEIIQRLSVIETKQDAFKEYQADCDVDRQKLTDRLVNIEKNESKQSGKSSIVNVLISTITAGIIAIIAAIIGTPHK